MLDPKIADAEIPAESAPSGLIAPYCILFFISGFPALIYQIVWQRSLFTIYGVNIESVTMIVTIFMLGLGLGSLAGGEVSKIRGLPIPLVFGAIEIAIGLFGVSSLATFHNVALWTAGASTAKTGLITAVLLLLPTLLMGSTLPLLVTHVLRINRNVGECVGLLYAVNTFGSAAACLFAALFTMRLFGQSGSIRMAATLNFIVGISALLLRYFGTPTEGADERPPGNEPVASGTLPFSLGIIMAAFTGFIALGYEIVWYRLYSFVSGGTAGSFALLLAFYLGGIAFGSLFVHDLCRERLRNDTHRALGVLGNLITWAAIASVLVGPILAVAVHYVNMLATLPLVFVAAGLLGAAFPLLAHISIGRASTRAGSRLSYLYLANIVGSASGSFIVGFILMNVWSIRQISVGLLLAALFPGAWLLAHGGRKARILGFCGLCAALLIAFFSPLLFSNLYRNLLGNQEGAEIPLRHVVETRNGVIAVTEDNVVYGGGVYDGRFNVDLNHDTNGIYRAFAIAGFHPLPAKVLVIGLSSGSWAQVVANERDFKDMTVVEINPGYLQLLPLYPAVSGLLQNPKVHITIDDGRRWLSSHPQAQFDLILMNTTFHWRANASNLLSVEFLTMARRHLRAGGILYYNTTSSDEARLTGATVFPYSLRLLNFLAVSDSPIVVDKSRWNELLSSYAIEGKPVFDLNDPAQRKRLAEVLSVADALNTPDQTREMGMESGESLRQRLHGLRLITDDNMGREWEH